MRSTFVAAAALSMLVAALPAFAESSGTVSDRNEPGPSRDDHEPARFGVLGGLGFPRPFSIEAMLKVERAVSIGLEYGFLPTTTVSDVEATLHSLSADLRVFPFQGPFFFGTRIGRQHFAGATSVAVPGYGTYGAAMSMDTWFVNPRLGLLWTFRSGLTIGFDAGLQIPLSHDLSTTLPAGIEVPSNVSSVADTFGARTIPTISLLQLGLLL